MLRYRNLTLSLIIPVSLLVLCASQIAPLAVVMSGDPEELDRCPVPKITDIRDVTTSSATIFWAASDSTPVVDLEWRAEGAPAWTLIPGIENPVVLDALDPCLTYEVRLIGHCSGLDSNPSAIVSFDADGCCRIPTGLRLVTNSDVSAIIAWDSVSFAFAHHLRFRPLGAAEWEEIQVMTNLAGLQDLESCTSYEVQVGSQCDLATTDYSESLVFQTTECGACETLAYCASGADDASAEWIDSVSLATLRFKSGNNQGYLLRNSLSTELERKRPYEFHVRPGSVFPGAEFYLRVWIDFNRDSVFTDSTELVVDPVAPITLAGWTGTLVIPDSIPLGNTRMRIALKAIVGQDTLKPESCGSFLFGEVEDYCIAIEDLCPEVVAEVLSVSENSATISWPAIEQAIVIVYQYKKVEDTEFGEPELTEDSIILLSGLEKCTEYVLQTLSVCVQDTSSVVQFFFTTECPNAVQSMDPLAADFRVYPNPFSEDLTISLQALTSGPAAIRLFGMDGRTLASKEIELREHEVTTAQINDLYRLPHGVYFLGLYAGARYQVVKVVK